MGGLHGEFGTPLTAFLGVLLGQLLLRRGATELDKRSKREEALRTFRWAAEHAASKDRRLVQLGTSTIQGLRSSSWFAEEDRVFIDLFIDSTLSELRATPDDESDQVEFVLVDDE